MDPVLTAGIAIFSIAALAIWLLVRQTRKRGEAEGRNESLREDESWRTEFDEEIAGPDRTDAELESAMRRRSELPDEDT